MSKARVLVTGGGGFVGSHLAAGFARLGHQVAALDQGFDAATRGRLAGVRLIEARLNAGTFAKLSGPADVVVHGAAITSSPAESGLSEFGHIKANLDLLLDALDGATAVGARQFVFLSSSGVFAADDAPDILTEDIRPTGSSAYALAKRAGEMVVADAGSDVFFTLIIRLGYLYGAFEAARPSRLGTSLIRRWLDDARAGQPIRVETPAARRDWTFVDDLAPALDAIRGASPSSGTLRHLGSCDIHSDRALAEAILRAIPSAKKGLSLGSGPATAKAPMGSSRRDALKNFAWTPLDRGLAALATQEMGA